MALSSPEDGARVTWRAVLAPHRCAWTIIVTLTIPCGAIMASRRSGARGASPPDKRVAFYCGTGWRASEAFFYAYLMGWPTIAVYDGGWWAWVQDPANPIAVGAPQRPLETQQERPGL